MTLPLPHMHRYTTPAETAAHCAAILAMLAAQREARRVRGIPW